MGRGLPSRPRLGVQRHIDAPVDVVWQILVDLDSWPRWGPSVAAATLDGGARRIEAGSTGRVRTVVGVELPFVIDEFTAGTRWAWVVAGVPATAHEVTRDGAGCLLRFTAPWWATAYLAVCAVALGRIARLAVANPI
ncbi:SRPBCC family protein [Mycolicibacterium sp. CBM1]